MNVSFFDFGRTSDSSKGTGLPLGEVTFTFKSPLPPASPVSTSNSFGFPTVRAKKRKILNCSFEKNIVTFTHSIKEK